MSDTAVLVVDMLNTYQHPDAEELIPNVAKIIEPLADLVRPRARIRFDVDLVYVNDNYGDFTAEFSDIVRSAINGARPDLVEPIVPAPTWGGRLMTKVRHSAFYSTPLAYLLGRLGNQAVDPDRTSHRAVHPLHRAGRVRAPLPCRDPDGCRRPHRRRPGPAALKMMEQNMSAELTTAADCLG